MWCNVCLLDEPKADEEVKLVLDVDSPENHFLSVDQDDNSDLSFIPTSLPIPARLVFSVENTNKTTSKRVSNQDIMQLQTEVLELQKAVLK